MAAPIAAFAARSSVSNLTFEPSPSRMRELEIGARRFRRAWGTYLHACFLTLLLVLSASAATAAPAKNWSFLYKADNIEVSTDCASPPTFKAEGILNVDIVDIYAILGDVPRRTEWVRYLSESRVIRDNQVDRVLVYNRYHLPWPASDRDSLIDLLQLMDPVVCVDAYPLKNGQPLTRLA